MDRKTSIPHIYEKDFVTALKYLYVKDIDLYSCKEL